MQTWVAVELSALAGSWSVVVEVVAVESKPSAVAAELKVMAFPYLSSEVEVVVVEVGHRRCRGVQS